MKSLISQFESIVCTNGDDTAFYISKDKNGDTNDKINNNEEEEMKTIGFTELHESTIAIACELYHRHSVGRRRHCNDCDFLESVLIVSTAKSTPSPAEAAAMLACIKLNVPFVPLDINGIHAGVTRCKSIIKDVKPVAAIVIVQRPTYNQTKQQEEEDDDDDFFMSKPAENISPEALLLDTHPSVIQLTSLGVHRLVLIYDDNGNVAQPLSGIHTLPLPSSLSYDDDDDDITTTQKDDTPLYIMYTSGSTMHSKPKA
eukprot:1664471-Ditylum_brightwellii.AAC.1